jgi:hypothetical protein
MTTDDIRRESVPKLTIEVEGKLCFDSNAAWNSLIRGTWEIAAQISTLNDQVRLLVERSKTEVKNQSE